ncbi:MAG: FAD-dependent oxidoreductase, partial [Pseudomonadota bacterium]
MNASRRRALQALASAGLASLLPLRASGAAGARVVVVGGGFAGATAAKYLRLWDPGVSVTLVEANREFVSCPVSNRVIAGTMSLRDITRNYDGLTAHGVRVTHDTATDIDPVKRVVKLGRGESLGYDRLILAPGIDFLYDRLPGLESAAARAQVPHAWKAGDQTMDLRKRIFALRPGGVFAMHVPKAPYRCPPGPYERATMVA